MIINMKIIIIIPTYNERENTDRMIETLAEILPGIPDHIVEVLYVDGNSPDGTAELIRSLQKTYSWLHLLVENKKEGLGMAYAKGMRYAMEKLDADYLMEFDSDFQHPPQDIPRLIAEINHGYDYIIGSRYIPGGSIPVAWSFKRKFLSVVGNIVARVFLILPQIHDVTGGFKLARVKGFMDGFDFSKLLSKSFAYKIHLLFYMVQKGAKVKEVPFLFAHRTSGESKIIKNEMQETLRVIFRLQMQNPKIMRFIKFVIVGGTGLVIQTAFFEVTSVFMHLLTPSIATVIGGEMAIISNFSLNNLWTFREYRIAGSKIIFKFLQFNLTSFIALGIQYTVLKIGEDVAQGSPFVIQFFFFGALILVLITNYIIYNKIIWKTKD
ncbi:MAG: Glycosyltransferase [Candidatus Amesbacteria bacterium GW2011_GWB1_47_19]|nr:MAG: Glycosyltransferase [Candidatus Amesbacteria bacterium GW2011_GWA1_44_24]KKU31385.1 MAG: Glycosyltransferase [Candidatus Amesbacteria bacterium GW2011_GWC1_46_24]KKU66963.1 MAG: Glycosyltransferase [Candidatus Amesbacteria bacterium GW2011_GWB1_47_19]HBC72820.1 glycosyltransferase family 2 protein [Candidatus Amesbacteria bacterium]